VPFLHFLFLCAILLSLIINTTTAKTNTTMFVRNLSLLAAVAFASVAADGTSPGVLEYKKLEQQVEFRNWMLLHQKTYGKEEDQMERMRIWMSNDGTCADG